MPVCASQYKEEVQKVKDRKPASPHEDLSYTTHAVWAASPPIFDELRQKAKARGLYNFFLPEVGKLSVLEYAPICEILGAFGLCNVAMNCTAPDTGKWRFWKSLVPKSRSSAGWSRCWRAKSVLLMLWRSLEWQAVMPPTSVPPSQGMEMSMWLMAINGTSVVLVVLSAKSLFFLGKDWNIWWEA